MHDNVIQANYPSNSVFSSTIPCQILPNNTHIYSQFRKWLLCGKRFSNIFAVAPNITVSVSKKIDIVRRKKPTHTRNGKPPEVHLLKFS